MSQNGGSKDYESAFREFHQHNPHVYAELVRLCRQAKKAGHHRFGIRRVWEVMRWNLMIQTSRPAGDFKLNDHLHSRYARLIMDKERDLVGIFELRELKT